MRVLKTTLIMIFILFVVSCDNGTEIDNGLTIEPESEKYEMVHNILENKSLNELNIHLDYNYDKDIFCYKNEDYNLIVFLDDIRYSDNCVLLNYSLSNDIYDYTGSTKYYFYKSDDDTGLLLSFDDYFPGNWEKYLDYFYYNNINVTWFCYGSYSRIADFCKKAQDMGFEVGYHTKNHIFLKNENATKTVVTEQAIDPLLDFYCDDIFFKSFAFPGGAHKSWMKPFLLKYYKFLRLFYNMPTYYTKEYIQTERVFYSNSIDEKWLDLEQFKIEMRKRLLITKIGEYIYPCTSHYILNDKIGEHFYDNKGEVYDNYTISISKLDYLIELLNYYKMNTLLYKDLY